MTTKTKNEQEVLMEVKEVTETVNTENKKVVVAVFDTIVVEHDDE